MTASSTARRTIIEELYSEALLLADEARASFDLRADQVADNSPNEARVALSIEGLRTTTRLMHVLAWLLNQRAYLSGELSEEQLRKHGRLPPDRSKVPGMIDKLHPEIRMLVRESERLHARVERLDAAWHAADIENANAVDAMHGQIARAFSA